MLSGRSVLYVAEVSQGFVGIAPIGVHLDEGLEKDGLPEEFLERFSGFGRHLFEGDTFFADDDAFLGLSFDIDDCIDMYMVLILLEAFNGHFDGVRYFLVVVEENFLPHDFADEEPCGFVGQLVLVKVRWSFRQEFLDTFEHRIDIKLMQGRDGHDFGLW